MPHSTRTLWMVLTITLAIGASSLMWVIGEQAAQDRAYQYRLNTFFAFSQYEHNQLIESLAIRIWLEERNAKLERQVDKDAKHRKPY